MAVFFTSSLLLVVFLVTHLILWKVRLPKHQIRALLIILVTIFGLWLVYAILLPASFLDVFQTAILYGSIGLSYLITYSAIEADSPTLSLMRFVSMQRAGGRHEDEVKQFLDKRPFMKRRLAALVESGLVGKRDGKYVVVGRGSLAFRFILCYRKLYGTIPRGG